MPSASQTILHLRPPRSSSALRSRLPRRRRAQGTKTPSETTKRKPYFNQYLHQYRQHFATYLNLVILVLVLLLLAAFATLARSILHKRRHAPHIPAPSHHHIHHIHHHHHHHTSIKKLRTTNHHRPPPHPRWANLPSLSSPPTILTLQNALFAPHLNRLLLPPPIPHKSPPHPRILRHPSLSRTIHPWTFPTHTILHIPSLTLLILPHPLKPSLQTTVDPNFLTTILHIRYALDTLPKTPWHNPHKITFLFPTKTNTTTTTTKPTTFTTILPELHPQNIITFSPTNRTTLLSFSKLLLLHPIPTHPFPNLATTLTSLKSTISTQHKIPLPSTCLSAQADTQTLWLLHNPSKVRHVPTLTRVLVALNHSLLRAKLASRLRVRMLHAPDKPCAPGTAREGCFDVDCVHPTVRPRPRATTMGFSKHCVRKSMHAAKDGQEEQPSEHMLRHMRRFGTVTFLVVVDGAGGEDGGALDHSLAYMPRGAVVVHVVRAPRGEARNRFGKMAGVQVVSVKERDARGKFRAKRFAGVVADLLRKWQVRCVKEGNRLM